MSDETTERLCDLAKIAVKKHSDIESAIKMVRRSIDRDTELRDALMEEILTRAIADAVYHARGSLKQTVKHSVCSRDPAALSDVAAAVSKAMLDSWLMPDGRRLGDVDGSELPVFAADAEERARGHQQVATMYRKLHALVGDAKVRDKVSNDQAAKLWREIVNGGPKPPRRGKRATDTDLPGLAA